MSFADDLRAAQARMLKAKKEEAERSKGRRKVAAGSAGGSTGAGSAVKNDWSPEDEMIALYLQMSESSKFLIENYAKKRKLSPRAMKMRMTAYGSLLKSNPDSGAPEQMRQIFQQFGRMDASELQKLVIQILRGEYNYREQADQKTIRRD